MEIQINLTAVLITLIICVTVGYISAHSGKDKKESKEPTNSNIYGFPRRTPTEKEK